MKRLLFQIHRWLGIVTALFMLLWFFTGLVIVYSAPLNQTRLQQRVHAEILAPEAGWLGIGEVWERSAAQRQELRKSEAARQRGGETSSAQPRDGADADAPPAEARLVRHGGVPVWLMDDHGRRLAISALDGSVHFTDSDEALKIAAARIGVGFAPRFVETADRVATLRNAEALKPFHRIAVDDGSGRELLISRRTGEIVQDADRIDRAMYWAGNWLHVFRPLELAGWEANRHDVLAWVSGIALVVVVTGLIIGWLRWRPGWFGNPTYAEGRQQPYRNFWFRWHFWTGLIGGIVALLFALSGFLNNNPGKIFSAPAASREEIARYVGPGRSAAMLGWRPASIALDLPEDVVELSWHRLGDAAVLQAYDGAGRRWAPRGDAARFSDQALAAAGQRLAGTAAAPTAVLQQEYDDYYYPRHNRGAGERPLPVLRVQFDDAGATRLYIDPADGRLLLKQDDSRRAFRWLFSALHHWDFGWLHARPMWDAWMIVCCLLGLAMAATGTVIGWRRLARSLARSPSAAVAAAPELTTEARGS